MGLLLLPTGRMTDSWRWVGRKRMKGSEKKDSVKRKGNLRRKGDGSRKLRQASGGCW